MNIFFLRANEDEQQVICVTDFFTLCSCGQYYAFVKGELYASPEQDKNHIYSGNTIVIPNPLYTVYMQHIMGHSGGMQEWVIQIPSIPILVSVLFPSLHLRIKFLLLVCIVFMRMRTKPHPHPVIS